MNEPKRRWFEVVSDPEYLSDIEARPLEELRSKRSECREGENELSFERRLCQARIDILSAELERRAGGEETFDLVEKLPQILATESTRSRGDHIPDRAPDFSVPRSVDVPRRRVEEIVGEQTLARLHSLGADEIRKIISSLADYESDVSARRRKVQEVVDSIQAEIVRRFVSGEADPTAALN